MVTNLIAVATYRRPVDLERLLSSLERSTRHDDVTVFVVDNDPEGTARPVVEAHSLKVEYCIESEPGIASARNRALSRFTGDFEAIIFVDDDEWVSDDWYSNLTAYSRTSGAEIVTGPVLSVIPEDAPQWIRRGGYHQRPIALTGTQLRTAATNNTLLARSAWARAGYPAFDTTFSSTGGSDTEFFWGVRRSGARIEYCAEARVSEHVPPSRLRFRWIAQRFLRNGIVDARVRMKYRDRPITAATKGLLRAAFSALRIPIDLIVYRSVRPESLSGLLIPVGRIVGLVGVRVHEYKR